MAVKKYADEVKADCPVGYWRLGDAHGSTTAADALGKGQDGKVSGGVTFGLPGFHEGDTAALFDGATGRIIVDNSDDLNPHYITMEAKVRWDGPSDFDRTIGQRIIEKSSYPQQAQYALKIAPTGHVVVDIRTSSATTNPPEAASINQVARGVETHIAATYKDNKVRIYLNGIPDPSGPISMPGGDGTISRKTPTPANLIESGVGIGNQTERDRPFNGLIDEVAIFPRALSEERIRAHYEAQFVEDTMFQYAAKVICGKSDGKVVAPGVYFTAINVHNPTDAPIVLSAKVAVALPGLQPGPVSDLYKAELGPDEALEIDCPDIFNPKIFKFPNPARRGFLKRFVVIESDVELDVVAVYSAHGKERQVETLHTERVPARRVVAGARRA